MFKYAQEYAVGGDAVEFGAQAHSRVRRILSSMQDTLERAEGAGSAEFAARSTASDGPPVIRGCARSRMVKRHKKYFSPLFSLSFTQYA